MNVFNKNEFLAGTSNSAKKRKRYHFNPEWELEFFFTSVMDKCICLICNSSVAVSKKGNVERHFRTVHPTFGLDFPPNSDERKKRLQELKDRLNDQQSVYPKLEDVSGMMNTVFTKPIDTGKAATIASYRVCRILASKKKPLEDGALIKEAFLEAADSLFDQFENKSEIMSAISKLQLSRSTVSRRIESMASDLASQLKSDLVACSYFSLQLAMSADIVDAAQVNVFIRMVFNDFSVKEELLKAISVKEGADGEDIHNAFKLFAMEEDIPLHKLVCITTDGVPSLTKGDDCFISVCQKDSDFPSFFDYHCIIHQHALLREFTNLSSVMELVVKVIKSVRTKVFQTGLFKTLIDEFDRQYGEFLPHANVVWLSKGEVLLRLWELLPQIRAFLQAFNEQYDELRDLLWLLDLAFLTDLTGKLNELNLELRGKNNDMIHMISSVKKFSEKLKLWISNLVKKDLKHFANLKTEVEAQMSKGEAFYESDRYVPVLKQLQLEFERRFTHFKKIEPIIQFISFPFNSVDVENISELIGNLFHVDKTVLKIEIITFQGDVRLKCKSSKQEFWTFVDDFQYPIIRNIALKLKSLFGSTYLCESSSFFNMKLIKNKYKTRMTDSHLDDCVRLAATTYSPNILKIVEDVQCQPSH